METLIETLGWIGNALLIATTAALLRLWLRTRTATARMLTFAFVVFTVGTLIGYMPWTVGETALAEFLADFRFLMTLSFPYLLLRFAHAFRPSPRWLTVVASVGLVAIGAYIVVLPVNFGSPTVDTTQPRVDFVLDAVVVWLLVVMPIAALQLFLAGRGQPTVARRRMNLLALATVFMFLAYLTAFLSPSYAVTVLRIASYVCVDLSAIAYVVGLAPPAALRTHWRRTEERELREATLHLMRATNRDEVLEGFMPKVARLIGARSAALIHADGTVAPVAGTPHDEAVRMVEDPGTGIRTRGRHLTMVPFGEDRIALVTSPVTPLLGEEELELLQWLGVVVELALVRCDHLARERAVAERLREIDQLKSEFVQIVAHDLRSPMATIGGMASTMRSNWNDLDEPTKLDLLDHIDDSTRRMSDLVVDVLDVARIESGELSFELAPFDLLGLVRSAVGELQLSMPERQLDMDAPVGELRVLGDPRRTRQVVDNVLSNAVKYSPAEEPIEVEVAARDGEVVVAVHDHGRGIPLEDQARIFEKFGRAVKGAAPPGSGLGLYICKAIVEAQGGRIWVESTPGVGSTFRFTVPLAA